MQGQLSIGGHHGLTPRRSPLGVITAALPKLLGQKLAAAGIHPDGTDDGFTNYLNIKGRTVDFGEMDGQKAQSQTGAQFFDALPLRSPVRGRRCLHRQINVGSYLLSIDSLENQGEVKG